jgi:hypothetical protein
MREGPPSDVILFVLQFVDVNQEVRESISGGQ